MQYKSPRCLFCWLEVLAAFAIIYNLSRQFALSAIKHYGTLCNAYLHQHQYSKIPVSVFFLFKIATSRIKAKFNSSTIKNARPITRGLLPFLLSESVVQLFHKHRQWNVHFTTPPKKPLNFSGPETKTIDMTCRALLSEKISINAEINSSIEMYPRRFIIAPEMCWDSSWSVRNCTEFPLITRRLEIICVLQRTQLKSFGVPIHIYKYCSKEFRNMDLYSIIKLLLLNWFITLHRMSANEKKK